MTKKSYSIVLVLAIALMVLTALPASADEQANNYVYLPVVQSNPYLPDCQFVGFPIWLDVYLVINTPGTAESPYMLSVNGETLMFIDAGTYYIGETHQLSYPLTVYQVNNIYLPPGSRTYTVKCALNSQPQPQS